MEISDPIQYCSSIGFRYNKYGGFSRSRLPKPPWLPFTPKISKKNRSSAQSALRSSKTAHLPSRVEELPKALPEQRLARLDKPE